MSGLGTSGGFGLAQVKREGGCYVYMPNGDCIEINEYEPAPRLVAAGRELFFLYTKEKNKSWWDKFKETYFG